MTAPKPFTMIEPVGSTDIARRLGVQPKTVNQWNHRGLLPPPRLVLSNVPIWDWAVIEEWARSTGRFGEAARRNDGSSPGEHVPKGGGE